MFGKIFSGLKIPVFAKLLDASATRQRTIAQNIANVETPGYNARDVDFSKLMENLESDSSIKLRQSSDRHLALSGSGQQVPIKVERSKELVGGVNNVDVDVEMVKSAENQLYYMANSKIVAGKFKALHTAIKGR